jgi:ribosomal protein L34E
MNRNRPKFKLNLDLDPILAAVIEEIRKLEVEGKKLYRDYFGCELHFAESYDDNFTNLELGNDQDSRTDFDFNVCRVCLQPEKKSKTFLSLFIKNRAELVREVTGCDVSGDKGKHKALICCNCFEEVKNVQQIRENLRKKIENGEENYFKMRRRQEEVGDEQQNGKVEMNGDDHNLVDLQNDQVKVAENLSVKAPRPDQKRLKEKANEVAKCLICGREFQGIKKKRNLKQHQQAVHEKLRPFQCDLCGSSFARKDYLNCHLKSHLKNPNFKPKQRPNTSDSTRSFRCSFAGCGKFYKTKHELTEHHKIHEGNLHSFLVEFH